MLYCFGYSILNLIAEPDLHFWRCDTLGLTPDNRDIDGILQPHKGLGKVPGMSIPIAANWQILYPELSQGSRFSAKISAINDDQSLGNVVIEHGEDEMRAAKTCINDCHILWKCKLLEFLDYGRSKSIVCKKGIPTSCNNDFGV